MRHRALVEHAASRAIATALAACIAVTPLHVAPQLALADPPSAEAQANLKRGFKAAAQGFLEQADTLLTDSIGEWQQTKQPPDELAALYKTRATVRQQQGRAAESLADYDRAVEQNASPDGKPDPAEVQRTYALRARANAALKKWAAAEADLSAAIDRLDALDALEATNPYLYSERAAVRARLGNFLGAAEDDETAELEFGAIGNKIGRLGSAADRALALFGAGDVGGAADKMRFVFKNKGLPASNNPDDIPLLQELSRKDAELHLAYAAHLFSPAGGGDRAGAETQWESGCIRLEAYVTDGQARLAEEAALKSDDAARADASGKYERGRASSVASQPLGALSPNSDLNARLNGLDPQSPYVTQRPQSNYFWYKTSEGDIERRDPGNQLAAIDTTLSCGKFRESEWVATNRPEWPPALRTAVAAYAEAVPQKAIVMPPKGGPPSKGEVDFGDSSQPRCDTSKTFCDSSYVSVWRAPLKAAGFK